jgi:predicted RNA methylase
MTVLVTIVDWSAVWQTIVAALAAGIGVIFAFSLAVLGATRWIDLSLDGRAAAAATAAVMGLIAFAVCIAAIVLGIVVMTTK